MALFVLFEIVQEKQGRLAIIYTVANQLKKAAAGTAILMNDKQQNSTIQVGVGKVSHNWFKIPRNLLIILATEEGRKTDTEAFC